MHRTIAKRWAKAERREVWQVDLEASHCTVMENGSMGAESSCNGGSGGAADVDQARTRAPEAAQCGNRGRCFDHDNRTLASKRRSSNADPVHSHQAVAHILGTQSQNQAQDLESLGKNCDSDDGEKSSNAVEVCAKTPVSCHCYTLATQLDSHSEHILERP